MARNRKLFAALTRRGPHPILRGDLAFAGIPGVVYTPATGYHLPGLAFGHEWLTSAEHYAGTLAHLASWGIVAAAPDSQLGLAPSVLNLSYDLGATLDVISGVRLGSGKISVSRDKLGLAGHGFGAAAAVFAAAAHTAQAKASPVKAVAAVFPAVTKPSAEDPAATLTMPGLVLATPDDAKSLRTDALEIAQSWAGAELRVVEKAEAAAFAEKRRLLSMVGLPGSNTDVQTTVRALLTGFLLYHLAGDKSYSDFADIDAKLPGTKSPDPEAAPVTDEDRVVALFR